MTDSHASKKSGGNKMVIFLLVGGCMLLAVAAFIVYSKKENVRQKVATKSKVEKAKKKVDVPTPLIISQPAEKRKNTITEISEKSGNTRKSGIKKWSGNKKSYDEPLEKLGTIDRNEVSKFMRTKNVQVQSCYEHRLRKNSLLEGKLDLNIGISSKGKATSVTVNSDTINDAVMLDCVRKKIRSWKFPKPENGRIVIAKTFAFKKKL